MILSKDYMLLRKYFNVGDKLIFFFLKYNVISILLKKIYYIYIKIRMVLNYGEVVEGKFMWLKFIKKCLRNNCRILIYWWEG